MRKMKKQDYKKYKKRVFFQMVLMVPLLGLFLSTFKNWNEGLTYQKETEVLKEKLVETLEEEDELKSQINKLQDPEYIARYAREKYLYSKNGEIIIRIEED